MREMFLARLRRLMALRGLMSEGALAQWVVGRAIDSTIADLVALGAGAQVAAIVGRGE